MAQRAKTYSGLKRPIPIDPESRARIDKLMEELEKLKNKRS
jgi:hypothetical protein